LRDLLQQHKIDIVNIQETKKEIFKDRILFNLSYQITNWYTLPAIGRSGGILLGVNSSKLEIIDCKILRFSITILLKNRDSGFE
jgi:hypothetical protein